MEPATTRESETNQAWRTGDRDAFADLVREHQRSVFFVALRTARGDEQLARDVVQRTFEQAWKKRESFRGEASAKTWLLTIATNLGRNELRRAWRHHETVPEGGEEAEPMGPTEPRALDDLQAKQARGLLREAVDALPERQREVALLRLYEDLSFPEVGAACGISANNAKVNFHHAVKKIRSFLTARGVTA
ncbi:MAG: sigma-70 family RNA polymerase sigma factor [Proteobacteria bacterium]|nr:sigma-70 family RNA polymerase sigma factor [Pseudomonadota bacterium]